MASAAFGGWRYRITRELAAGLIDCSTLTSQAHWAGAGVGIPFIAETQRCAYSAQTVAPGEMLPADVLVRYRSRADSADGRHNHVVLYLGEHPRLGPWVIESAESVNGVRVRPMRDVDADGGIRRFLPNPTKTFSGQEAALRLARAVPKLGRLGSRLTAGLLDPRRHRGVDIYLRRPCEVHAPLGGRVVYEAGGRDGSRGVAHVIAAGLDELVTLRPIVRDARWPSRVEAGEPIGHLASAKPMTCNSIPSLRDFPSLHLEYWSSRALFCDERGLPPPSIGDERRPLQTLKSFNPIYAIKLGLLTPPIRSRREPESLELELPASQ
ncbi:MAG TPA: hypothetical protein VIY71_09435 [Solirubrobacterales bacterium]